jgi:hypothetical protein
MMSSKRRARSRCYRNCVSRFLGEEFLKLAEREERKSRRMFAIISIASVLAVGALAGYYLSEDRAPPEVKKLEYKEEGREVQRFSQIYALNNATSYFGSYSKLVNEIGNDSLSASVRKLGENDGINKILITQGSMLTC